MKDTIIRFDNIRSYDIVALADHFEKMAEEGWMIEKVGRVLNTYRRCLPKRVKFSLMFIDKSYDSPMVATPARDFIGSCRELGWQHIITYNNSIHVFVNENPSAPPLETDPVVQANSISKNLRSSGAVYIAIGLIYAVRSWDNGLRQLINHPYMFFMYDYHKILPVELCFLIILFTWGIYSLIGAAKIKRAAIQENRMLPLKSNTPALIMGAMLFLPLSLMYYSVAGMAGVTVMVFTYGLFAIFSGHTKEYRNKNSKWKTVNDLNRLLMGIVFAFIFIAGTILTLYINSVNTRNQSERTVIDTNFLTIKEVNVYTNGDRKAPADYYYDIVITDNRKLYDILYNDILYGHGYEAEDYTALDRQEWGVDSIMFIQNPYDHYIVKKDNKILNLYMRRGDSSANLWLAIKEMENY